MRYIYLTVILFLLILNSFAQKDNSLKITASLTGLGASYELNPAKVVYVEGGLSSAFTVTRANLQSKLLLYSNDHFKFKSGVEGAYILGAFQVGGITVDYYKVFQTGKTANWAFMPMVSLEGKVIGIEIPVIVRRDFSSFFPIVTLTFNVSKDEPAEKVARKKVKK